MLFLPFAGPHKVPDYHLPVAVNNDGDYGCVPTTSVPVAALPFLLLLRRQPTFVAAVCTSATI